jgi:hypothetical protein
VIYRRVIKYVMVVAAVLAVPVAAAEDSLVDRLLRVAGLTAAPAQMRGPEDEVETGNIWIVTLDRQTAKRLTTEGGYRSPVFSPGGESLYALKGDMVVRIPFQGGTAVAVLKLSSALKLVGFDTKSREELVVLFDSSNSPLGVVSLNHGSVTPLPYDPKSNDQRRILAQVRAQHRVYGDAIVFTKTESKRGLSRNIEWTDVYLQRGNAAPQNLSACDGVSCAQPAMSPDRRSIVFVKAER